MLGCGVVGGSVARELASNSSDLAARAGAKLELTKIAVRNLGKRDGVADSLLTTDAESVVTDPEIQLVIEVMGGIEPARELILKAMANGKPSSSILVKMKLVVPLTIPITRLIRSPTNDSRSGLIIGIAPATAAS